MEKTPFPNSFDLIALYGRNTGYSDESDDCRIYHLNNETGAGTITIYHVFQGIQAAFNDIHMAYCNLQQNTASNMIEINHCTEGRFECDAGEQLCCYMAPGDMAVKSSCTCSENACFPTRHYHGISIFIEPNRFSEELLAILKMLSVDFDKIHAMVSNQNQILILRKNETASHIFSELYTVRETHRAGYLKLKVLELLMLLERIPQEAGADAYFSSEQTELAHHLRDHLLTNREGYVSLAQLAAEHEMSVSHLQKLFKQVYGVPVYRYIKEYRLEQAAVELVRSRTPVTEIAQHAGYDNASKFSESFKKRYGKTPSHYRADKKQMAKRSIGNKTE